MVLILLVCRPQSENCCFRDYIMWFISLLHIILSYFTPSFYALIIYFTSLYALSSIVHWYYFGFKEAIICFVNQYTVKLTFLMVYSSKSFNFCPYKILTTFATITLSVKSPSRKEKHEQMGNLTTDIESVKKESKGNTRNKKQVIILEEFTWWAQGACFWVKVTFVLGCKVFMFSVLFLCSVNQH